MLLGSKFLTPSGEVTIRSEYKERAVNSPAGEQVGFILFHSHSALSQSAPAREKAEVLKWVLRAFFSGYSTVYWLAVQSKGSHTGDCVRHCFLTFCAKEFQN